MIDVPNKPTAPGARALKQQPSFASSLCMLFTVSFFSEMGDKPKELEAMFNTVALVSALMLTMVSLSPDGGDRVGDKLDAYIDHDTAENLYTCVAFAAIGFFFLSMFFSAWFIMLFALAGDEDNGPDAACRFLKQVSFISRFPLMGMVIGNFCWLFLVLWCLLTNLPGPLAIAMLSYATLLCAGALFCLTRTVQALYSVSVA